MVEMVVVAEECDHDARLIYGLSLSFMYSIIDR